MDYGASFNVTHSNNIIKNFKQYQGKVRLVDNKSLHIIGVGDMVLKTNLGMK